MFRRSGGGFFRDANSSDYFNSSLRSYQRIRVSSPSGNGVDYFKWAQTTTNPKILPGQEKPNQSLRKMVARLSSPKKIYSPYVNDYDESPNMTKKSWMPVIKSPQKSSTYKGFRDVWIWILIKKLEMSWIRREFYQNSDWEIFLWEKFGSSLFNSFKILSL